MLAGAPTKYGKRSINYGADKLIVKDGTTKFTLTAPYNITDPESRPRGARVDWDFKSLSAYFCADIKTMAGVHNGGVFAMYVTSGEPYSRFDKWDELDFEFLLRNPGSAWLNTWRDGLVVPGQEGYYPLEVNANAGFHRYCIDWSITAGVANWTADGVLLRTTNISGWKKPLQPIMSFWGESDHWTGFTTWPEVLSVEVKNVAYHIRV